MLKLKLHSVLKAMTLPLRNCCYCLLTVHSQKVKVDSQNRNKSNQPIVRQTRCRLGAQKEIIYCYCLKVEVGTQLLLQI